MIPGGCHSNGFSEIGALDVSGVAFNNHPGGARLGGRAPGWRPWKRANGRNVEAARACRATAETSFWLHKPGTGGAPAVVESYYDRPKWTAPDRYHPRPEDLERIYYLSRIGPYSFSATCTPSQTGREVHRSGHVFAIRPECDRLLLAQNVAITARGAFDTSKASLRWYAPRKIEAFGNPSRLDTSLRPFMPPDYAIAGWGGGPPYESPRYADWRWNPKKPSHRCRYGEGSNVYLDLEKLADFYTPAEIRRNDWGAWSDPEDGVMLYMIDRDTRTDPPGPWYTVYWQEGGAGIEPENFGTSRLFAGLQGEDAFEGFHAAICVDSVSNADIWNDGNGDPLFRQGDAFDLRLYCRTYYYKVWRLDNNVQTGETTATKIGRFYFNTMVYATIRQIAPVPPAA